MGKRSENFWSQFDESVRVTVDAQCQTGISMIENRNRAQGGILGLRKPSIASKVRLPGVSRHSDLYAVLAEHRLDHILMHSVEPARGVVVKNQKSRVTAPRRFLELSGILQLAADAIRHPSPYYFPASIVCHIRTIFVVRIDLLHFAKYLNVVTAPDSEIWSALRSSRNWFALNLARHAQLLELFLGDRGLRDQVFGQLKFPLTQA